MSDAYYWATAVGFVGVAWAGAAVWIAALYFNRKGK